MTGETRGCTCEFEVEHGYPALVDDEKTAVFLREKLQKAGMNARKAQAIMGVEDFAFHTMKVKNKKPPLDTTLVLSYNEQRKAMKETSTPGQTHRKRPVDERRGQRSVANTFRSFAPKRDE